MLRSFLIGLVAGQRSMAPLALLAGTRRDGRVADDVPLAPLFDHPLVAAGAVAMGGLEMAGDKQKTAPDRIVPIGLAVRTVTAGYAGAALAPANRRVAGAAIAIGAALAGSYIGWRLRCAAMARYRQTTTGFVEDAVVYGGGLAITQAGAKPT